MGRLLVFSLFVFSFLEGIESQVYVKIAPYLLPSNHPVKIKLDQIFSEKKRALLTIKSMKKAGFNAAKPRKFTRLIVGRHPQLPGYIIKAYLDNQRYYKDKPEYELWMDRINGVNKIKHFIKKHGLGEHFKVPKKWIYLVPENPPPPADFQGKLTILVEEDMNLLDAKANAERWKSEHVTQEMLNGAYAIIHTIGLKDCCKIDNIPFSTDGKIAFIDTQTHGEKVLGYNVLGKSMSDKNKKYWKKITKK